MYSVCYGLVITIASIHSGWKTLRNILEDDFKFVSWCLMPQGAGVPVSHIFNATWAGNGVLGVLRRGALNNQATQIAALSIPATFRCVSVTLYATQCVGHSLCHTGG